MHSLYQVPDQAPRGHNIILQWWWESALDSTDLDLSLVLMASLLFVLICTQANLGRRKLLKSPHVSLELFFIDFYVLFN